MTDPSLFSGLPHGPLAVARKVSVSVFIAFHLASITFWNIPALPFSSDHPRMKGVPAWEDRLERRLFAWKKHLLDEESPWVDVAYTYCQYTQTTQNWWLFAPNPPRQQPYLTIKAVVAWNPDGSPVYDAEPVSRSYPFATLHEAVSTFNAPFVHDSKFVENLTSPDWDPAFFMSGVARYYFDRYEVIHGRPPLEIHVICSMFELPDPFSGIPVKNTPPNEWVFWYYHR